MIKKGVLVLAFLVLFLPLGYSTNYFKIQKSPIIRTEVGVTAPIQVSLKNEGPIFSNILSLDFDSLLLDSGFSVNEKSTDSIIDLLVTPITLQKFKWSLWLGYHLYDYFTSFYENDFLFGSFVIFNPIKSLRIKIDNGSILKLTSFKNNDINNPIFKCSYFLGLSIIWDINHLFRTYAQACSTSTFDYSLFGTPFFTLGFEVNCTNKIVLGTDFQMKLIDMVAVAENISEMLLRFYLRIKL